MRLLALTILCGTISPAFAEEMPPAVEAMLRQAARTGDVAIVKTVARVAKEANPDAASSIDDLARALVASVAAETKARREAMLAAQGLFDGWTGQGETGFAVSTGNTDEINGTLALKLAKEGLKTRHKLNGLADYGRSSGATTRQKFNLAYSINYSFRDGFYTYANLGWERDTFAGFDHRLTESLGLGYRVIDEESMTLDLDAGPAMRQTWLTDNGHESEWAGRIALAYRWTIRDGLDLTQDASALLATDSSTLISVTALSAKLTGALSGRLSFNVQNETDPPDDRVGTDTATRATLVYQF